WSEEEVEAFEQRYPIGTQARLALALFLYTACRLEDVVRFGPQHFRNARCRFTQAKNEHKNPIHIDIPVHSELEKILNATQSQHLTFLVMKRGAPFTPRHFGKRFKDWCRQANLPHCSSHGLRKVSATRLADAGCSPHEIMAITGHKTLEEV